MRASSRQQSEDDAGGEPPMAPTASTSAAALQRTASKTLRTKRYRYQLNDLPPPPPAPTAALPQPPPKPTAEARPFPSAERVHQQATGGTQPLRGPWSQSTSPETAVSSREPPFDSKPVRPPRSSSRPPPPPLLSVPGGGAEDAFDFRLPKALRRRSRSIGPTAAPFIRGHRRQGPATLLDVSGLPTHDSAGHQPLVNMPEKMANRGEDAAVGHSTDRSTSPEPAPVPVYEPPATREESLRTLRRMSRTVAMLAVRPLPTPPVVAAAAAGATPLRNAPPSTVGVHYSRAPQSTSSGNGKAAAGAGVSDIVQFPAPRAGIKRVSRSFTNLSAMYALDALQTEDRATRALDTVDRRRADAFDDERTGRSRSTHRPPPLDLSKDDRRAGTGARHPHPPHGGNSTRPPTRSPRMDVSAHAAPSPPLSPPAGSRRDSTSSNGHGGSRVLSSAAMYRMKAMSSNMSRPTSNGTAAFPTLSVNRPQLLSYGSEPKPASKPRMSFHRPMHSVSSTTSVATTTTSHTTSRSLGSAEKDRKRGLMDRVAPATMRTPDLNVVVSSPVDPVAAPGGRLSFLQHKMKKPYMGERF